MLSRFKTALYNVVGSFDPGESNVGALGPGVTSTLPTASGVSRSASQSSSSREKVIWSIVCVFLFFKILYEYECVSVLLCII